LKSGAGKESNLRNMINLSIILYSLEEVFRILREHNWLEDLGIDGSVNIKMDLKQIRCEAVWTGFIWLRIGTSVLLL
jgi:hypothetical protein